MEYQQVWSVLIRLTSHQGRLLQPTNAIASAVASDNSERGSLAGMQPQPGCIPVLDRGIFVSLCQIFLVAIFVASIALTPTSTAAQSGRFLGAKQAVYPGWFKQSFLDFREDIAEAGVAGKTVLLLFHQDGCPYCNELVERNLSQRDIEHTLKQKFEVIALNIWGNREVVNIAGQQFSEKEFAAALSVQFTPTLVFFDQHANEALRLNGYVPPKTFAAALEFVSSARAATQSFREFQRAQRPQFDIRASESRSAQATRGKTINLTDGAKRRPTLLIFEQADCPACDTTREDVLDHPSSAPLMQQFRQVRMDMWSSRPVITPTGKSTTVRTWAKELGIHYAPTLVLLDGTGQEIIRADAHLKRFHIQGLMHYVASDAYQHEPNFQRYLDHRAEQLRAAGHDVNIWQ